MQTHQCIMFNHIIIHTFRLILCVITRIIKITCAWVQQRQYIKQGFYLSTIKCGQLIHFYSNNWMPWYQSLFIKKNVIKKPETEQFIPNVNSPMFKIKLIITHTFSLIVCVITRTIEITRAWEHERPCVRKVWSRGYVSYNKYILNNGNLTALKSRGSDNRMHVLRSAPALLVMFPVGDQRELVSQWCALRSWLR